MKTFSKYRVIRKYTIDIFDSVRKKKFKKPIRVFFVHVYKERVKSNLTNCFIEANERREKIYKRVKRFLYSLNVLSFFSNKKAQRIHDKLSEPKSFYGYWLTQYKLFTYFYNKLSRYFLTILWNKARKGHTLIFNFFLCLLESRIDSLLIRLNWVRTKHMIPVLLKKKRFLVNHIPVVYPNYILKDNSILSIRRFYRKLAFEQLKGRQKKRIFFYKTPFYLEVNNKIMSCLIIKSFVKREHVKFPMGFHVESLMYINFAKK